MACGLGDFFAGVSETDVGSTETAGGSMSDGGNYLFSLAQDRTKNCKYNGKTEENLKDIVWNTDPSSPNLLTFSYFIDPGSSIGARNKNSGIDCTNRNLRGLIKIEPINAKGCTNLPPSKSKSGNICLVTIDAIANDLKTLSCELNGKGTKQLKSLSLNDLRIPRGQSHLTSHNLSLLFCYSKQNPNVLTHFIVIQGRLLDQTSCETFADKGPSKDSSTADAAAADDDSSDEQIASNKLENRIVVSNHEINFEDEAIKPSQQRQAPYLYVGNLTESRFDPPDLPIKTQLQKTGKRSLSSILNKIGIDYDKLNKICEQGLEDKAQASIKQGSLPTTRVTSEQISKKPTSDGKSPKRRSNLPATAEVQQINTEGFRGTFPY